MYACRGFESIHQGHFPTTILKIDFFQNYQICQIIFGFHFFVHLSSWWSVCPRINRFNSTKHVWNGDWTIGDPRGPKGMFVYFLFVWSGVQALPNMFDSIQSNMYGMVIDRLVILEVFSLYVKQNLTLFVRLWIWWLCLFSWTRNQDIRSRFYSWGCLFRDLQQHRIMNVGLNIF